MAEAHARYRSHAGTVLIEIGLTAIQQLFNSLDPSPFREKDLDADAEEYIVGAVREFPLKTPLKLVFHVPSEQMAAFRAASLQESIRNYFAYRRELAERDLRFQLRIGRTSLVIGLAFLAACLVLRELLLTQDSTPAYVFSEGLLIAGWVAMWRPLQIFLYDWWPIRSMARVYEKLSNMPVELVPVSRRSLEANAPHSQSMTSHAFGSAP